MAYQWNDFRSAPATYLLTRKGNLESLIAAMTQVICSEQEKDEQLKILILTTWQETAQVLFKESSRLESVISALNEAFRQQRSTAGAFFLSQILCTITSLLIQMEELLTEHQVYLVDFIVFLFEIVEKVKSESNLLLKSMACDCLTELEMSYPGLLASKVGHFYGMSQAENSYVHQHYTMLFTTVLNNAVQLFILQQHGNSIQAQDNLVDLLSHSDPLRSFKLPETFKEHAQTILTKPALSSSLVAERFSEVKKGVLSVIDNSYLLSPPCLSNVAHKLISIVDSCRSLSPKVLKRLLSHSFSHDIQLFHLVLSLRGKFGGDICDSGDNQDIHTRQLIHAGQPRLSDEQRALVWGWLLERLRTEGDVGRDITSPVDEGLLSVEEDLSQRIVTPTVFDSLDIFLCKCKALFREDYYANSILCKPIRQIASNVLKMVQYDMGGPPAVTLYKVLLAYLQVDSDHNSSRTKEVEKLVLDITLAHPQLIPHTIDFIGAVHNSHPDSSLPLNVLSEITQYLVTVELSQILIYLYLHLLFIRHAATNPQISPIVLVQLLLRILKESSICESGVWDIGNLILDICTTLMQLHQTELIFNDLSTLLQLLAHRYKDLDIRDRSRFYHQLLLTVSGEKLFAILSLASDTATGSSLAAIVEARISDNAFPSAPTVRVLRALESSTFLSLSREEGNETVNHYQPASEGQDSDSSLQCERAGSGEETTRKFPIKLQYRVHYEKKPKDISQRIFALVLKLSTNGPYYSSPDIFLPCLCASNKVTSESSKMITLSFYPKQPVPAEFNINVTFSTDDGLSYSVALDPIKLEFSDLFQPVCIPPSVSASKLFESLWAALEASDHKGAKDSQGVLSIQHLPKDQNEWSFNCAQLHAFEIHCELNQDSHVHKVMIFLPPSFYLLLQFQLHEDMSSVFIATDSWDVLPLAHRFLQQLVSN